ncbi:hypothetical protein GN956_G15152 [Arapaima gigas]
MRTSGPQPLTSGWRNESQAGSASVPSTSKGLLEKGETLSPQRASTEPRSRLRRTSSSPEQRPLQLCSAKRTFALKVTHRGVAPCGGLLVTPDRRSAMTLIFCLRGGEAGYRKGGRRAQSGLEKQWQRITAQQQLRPTQRPPPP